MKINSHCSWCKEPVSGVKCILIVCLFCFVIHASIGATNNYVILGQPRETTEQKLNTIILPVAPFVTASDDDQDIIYIFGWLEQMSVEGDPEGVGVRFLLDFKDETTGPKSDSMLQWLDDDVVWDVLPYPQIRRVRILDYVKYLSTVRNLDFEITEGKLRVFRRGLPTL